MLPVLWHLKVSNYNEKARWALDYKGIAHERRAMDAGFHAQKALELWGGRTFPVLVLEDEAIGDSTDIIAALERLRPEPALYPADDGARKRALELEDYFDELLGPAMRRCVIGGLIGDPELFLDTFAPDMPAEVRQRGLDGFAQLRESLTQQFELTDTRFAEAYETLAAVGERLREERGDGDHLVGDAFTVADLTLASLVSPAVAPEQFPYPQPQRDHPLLAPVRTALDDAGILEWTRKMYAQHRPASAEVKEVLVS